MTPLALGIGSSPIHSQSNGLLFRYGPGITLASLGGTFTRASSATYIDANGVLQTVAAGVPREWLHYINGVPHTLLEGARTNSFLNSDTPATHTSPSLGTGTYFLWMVGTGSIAVAGATATITGAGTATAGTPVTFTVTVAGTVTFTVTGSPTRGQCENGAFASSYIATAGSAVTRSADNLTFPWTLGQQSATAYAKFVELGTGQTNAARVFQVGGPSDPRWLVNVASPNYRTYLNANISTGVASATIGQVAEQRSAIALNGAVQFGQSVNGGAETVDTASIATAFGTLATNALTLNSGVPNGAEGFTAIQAFKIALGVRDLQTMRTA